MLERGNKMTLQMHKTLLLSTIQLYPQFLFSAEQKNLYRPDIEISHPKLIYYL